MSSKQPDWEISKIYFQTLEIIKQNKLLWVLGLAAAGGNSANLRFLSNTSNFSDFFNHHQPSTTPNLPHSENFTDVLGAATSSPFQESIKAIFTPIPTYFYIILGLEALILIFIGIVIGVIFNALAQGLLLQNTFDTVENKKASIDNPSQIVLPKLKPLIWLQIVPGLIFILISGLSFIFLVVLAAALPGGFKTIPILLIIIALGAFIYWAIHLTLAQIWAPRLVLLENLSGKSALFSGLKLAKKKFWASILLGLINNIFAAVIIGIPMAIILSLVITIASNTHFSPAFGVTLIILSVPFLIAGIIGFMLLAGSLNAFKAVVWTLAYRQIRRKYD